MIVGAVKRCLPGWKNAGLAVVAAGLLILAFPDFEYWFLAWFALVPLMWAIEREGDAARSLVLGWLFGTVFFFGTCWWLTFAPITYAGFPWPLAYFLMLLVAIGAGVFPALFAAMLAVLLRRFGSWAFLAAPFVWVFTEFLRYWLTGNNWNAIGYSQAFVDPVLRFAHFGGVALVGFLVLLPSTLVTVWLKKPSRIHLPLIAVVLFVVASFARGIVPGYFSDLVSWEGGSLVIAIQPYVPMSGVNQQKLEELRKQQFNLAEEEIKKIREQLSADSSQPLAGDEVKRNKEQLSAASSQPSAGDEVKKNKEQQLADSSQPSAGDEVKKEQLLADGRQPSAGDEVRKSKEQQLADSRQPSVGTELPTANRQLPTVVILPESPMNFMYNDDRDFQRFVREFTTRNNVSLIFNSAEPDPTNGKYFNSAMMIGPDGKPVAQYDKIYLLPFGEAVPVPLEGIVPGFVGNFSYGREYDLLPFGDAKGGIMICFESHFGQLGREYVRNGADVLIEMTNDGYLGPTPVLRQHLANAVFRAVETNRPVLRVTNVGITSFIDAQGTVRDPLPSYQEGTRVWTVSKSDGSQTFYVRYGDWFAWLCSIVTIVLLGAAARRRRSETTAAETSA